MSFMSPPGTMHPLAYTGAKLSKNHETTATKVKKVAKRDEISSFEGQEGIKTTGLTTVITEISVDDIDEVYIFFRLLFCHFRNCSYLCGRIKVGSINSLCQISELFFDFSL